MYQWYILPGFKPKTLHISTNFTGKYHVTKMNDTICIVQSIDSIDILLYDMSRALVQSSPVQSSPVQSSHVTSRHLTSPHITSSGIQSSPVTSSPASLAASSLIHSSCVHSSHVQSIRVQSSSVHSHPVVSSRVASSVSLCILLRYILYQYFSYTIHIVPFILVKRYFILACFDQAKARVSARLVGQKRVSIACFTDRYFQ